MAHISLTKDVANDWSRDIHYVELDRAWLCASTKASFFCNKPSRENHAFSSTIVKVNNPTQERVS